MTATRQQGGSFLFGGLDPADVLVPEALDAEHREIARTTRDFATREVKPQREALERHEWEVARRLLRRAGELGLSGVEVPEAYGGLELDRPTAAVVSQELAAGGASFGITFGVHTGIGLMPIVYFGSPEQKRRYLPRLVAGELVCAYALTEPGSGSDALAARTTARLSQEGTHYILNGTKQWITNAGFADLYVVYAKVDGGQGGQFSAFLVERAFPGVSVGPEEKKTGYSGSSTAQLILQDARVPLENTLHRVGKGHQVAFNTLNIGRFKLAPACLGGCINILGLSTRYAQERQQFGRPIASFRLIQQKLAAMAIRTYALEALTYRLAALMDEATRGLDLTGAAGDQAATALAEYAIECSIAKVFATEVLDYVVDEGVQIHGGYGYMREYEVENAYRDSRVNRIFEGTNEINRLLIPGTLFRRLGKGQSPATDAMAGAAGELARLAGLPEHERPVPEVGRALFWTVAGLALRAHPEGLEEEQETLACLADIAIQTFAAESVLARAARAETAQGAERAAAHRLLADAFAADALRQLATRAEDALAYLGDGAGGREALAALRRLSAGTVNRVQTGRQVAEQVLAAGGWLFGR